MENKKWKTKGWKTSFQTLCLRSFTRKHKIFKKQAFLKNVSENRKTKKWKTNNGKQA